MVLSCKDIQKSYGTDIILESVSFFLEEKEKCAIIGANGAGKSTLFKIITNDIPGDGGEVYISRGARIGYMSQEGVSDEGNTLYDELLSVFDRVRELEAAMRDMEHRMAELDGPALDDLMRRYTLATSEFERSGGYEYQSRVRGVIKGLGFTQEDSSKLTGAFSGGQKTRICLGKLLLSEPDVLLLDEPTNHLDIESIEWLEDYLRNYSGGILIISHDRYFLDKIVTKVVEIENKRSSVYNGNYSFYANKKRTDREIWLKHYIAQQKEINRQEEMIRTIRSYATEKALIRAKSKEKMLEKVERIDKPDKLPDTMRMHLIPRKESGNDVLSVKELAKSFDRREIFKNVGFEVKKGEKVAIIGPNGVGKTTLFRAILGKIKPDSGSIRTGVNVVIGYYAQEHIFGDKHHKNTGVDNGSGSAGGLPTRKDFNPSVSANDKTLFDEISDAFPRMTKQQIRDTLAAFIFTGDDVFKTVGSLSGGERGRVELAKIMLGEANFLILDEPTNHLDILSKDILEQALQDYSGTLLYISHDRYFINNTAQKIIELSPDGVRIFLGNYDYYMEKKAEEKTEAEERASANPDNAGKRRKKDGSSADKRLSVRIERTEREIHDLEERIGEIDERIHNDESVYTNAELLGEIYAERTKLEDKLNGLYEEYLELAADD